MPEVRVYGLGGYYTTGNPSPGANASAMQNLVYAVKGRKWPGRFTIQHPWFPGPAVEVTINYRPEALDYAATLFDSIQWDFEQVASPAPKLLIPVPSSWTMMSNPHARWGAADLADRLAARNYGTVARLVYNKRHIGSTSQGAVLTWLNIRNNYVQTAPLPPGMQIVYMDDTLTWGKHMAAIHSVLGCPYGAVGLVVAMTTSDGSDAYRVRTRTIPFEEGIADIPKTKDWVSDG